MKRILVLGSTGMLGSMVLKVLSKEESFVVQGTQSENPGAPDYFNTEAGVYKFDNFDYLINCIGILSNAINAHNSLSVIRAIKINALFPHELAGSTKARIIHISTDGVFSGKAEQYDEDAPHDCPDVYGKIKSLGEVNADNVLNIRTSIIGPSPHKKAGLLEWFLSQPDGGTISGYTNHIWNGATTLQYAELCAKLIKQDAFNRLWAESSVFHFAPNQPVTKYKLLDLFKVVFKKDVTINPAEDPSGHIKRMLKTKYEGLKKLYPHDRAMEEALEELKKFSHPS